MTFEKNDDIISKVNTLASENCGLILKVAQSVKGCTFPVSLPAHWERHLASIARDQNNHWLYTVSIIFCHHVECTIW